MPDGWERRDLAVEYRPLDSLVADARNARTHSEVRRISLDGDGRTYDQIAAARRSKKKDTTGC
jgi:hypothetical protein